ncbi:MAG: PAS domain S-box protein, partial [Chloroflexi bacterium]|nr:PAS domain S-box protein [Chloroflexota bacterium]
MLDPHETEAALRASEERLRLALDAAAMGVWDADLTNGTGVWSERAAAQLGLPPDTEVSYERYLACVHPDDREQVRRTLSQALRGSGEYSVEYRVVWPDGGIRHHHSAARVHFDANHRPIRLVGLTRDVTEQAEAAAALHASRERLDRVLDNAPIILFATDRDGRVTLSQGRALEALGLRREALHSVSMFEAFADIPSIVGPVRRALNGETVVDQVAFRGRALNCTYTPMFDTDGVTIVGVTGVASDITERVAAEDEVRKLEAQNQLLIDNAMDLVVAYDLTGRFTFVNRRWEALTGYSVQEALGMTLADIIDQSDYPRIADNMRRRILGEPVAPNYELRLRNRSGKVVWVDANVSLTRRNGEVVGLQAFVRDITARKVAEEALAHQARFDRLTDLPNRVLLHE